MLHRTYAVYLFLDKRLLRRSLNLDAVSTDAEHCATPRGLTAQV